MNCIGDDLLGCPFLSVINFFTASDLSLKTFFRSSADFTAISSYFLHKVHVSVMLAMGRGRSVNLRFVIPFD